MNSCQFSTSITALANFLASKLSLEQLTLLAALFVQLGDTFATIVTHRTICESNDDKIKN